MFKNKQDEPFNINSIDGVGYYPDQNFIAAILNLEDNKEEFTNIILEKDERRKGKKGKGIF